LSTIGRAHVPSGWIKPFQSGGVCSRDDRMVEIT